MHTIRLASEPSAMPGMVWLRLASDPSGYLSEDFDAARRNHVPTPIAFPPGPDLAVNGQPALGWVTLLDVRQASDGRGLELWGLTRWLAAANEYLPDGEQLWARVHIADAIDARTGVHVGARLQPVELVPPPFAPQFTRSPIANSRHIRLTKDHPTMTTQNSSPVAILLAALPAYREGAPNDAVALERAAREKIEGAKQLSRERLYELHVHPALAKLAEQKLLTASKAGHLRQPLPAFTASALRSGGKVEASRTEDLPVLDVRDQTAGRNATEKLILHVKAKNPRIDHDAAFLEAMRLKETHRVLA